MKDYIVLGVINAIEYANNKYAIIEVVAGDKSD